MLLGFFNLEIFLEVTFELSKAKKIPVSNKRDDCLHSTLLYHQLKQLPIAFIANTVQTRTLQYYCNHFFLMTSENTNLFLFRRKTVKRSE